VREEARSTAIHRHDTVIPVAADSDHGAKLQMSLCDQISLKPTASDVSTQYWLDSKFAEGGVTDNVAADLKLCLKLQQPNQLWTARVEIPDNDTIEVAPTCAAQQFATMSVLRSRTWLQVTNLPNDEPGGFGICSSKSEQPHRIKLTAQPSFVSL
jgi:hypothetical protein